MDTRSAVAPGARRWVHGTRSKHTLRRHGKAHHIPVSLLELSTREESAGASITSPHLARKPHPSVATNTGITDWTRRLTPQPLL